MPQVYNKPCHALMHDAVAALGIRKGDVFDKTQIVEWFASNYPKLKETTIRLHMDRMATNFKHRLRYNPKPGIDDLLFRVDTNRYRLYDPERDAPPIRNESDLRTDGALMAGDAEADEDCREFAYERDLRDFLAKNLELVEPGLRLYEEEEITGVEYDAGGRYIDILAVDKDGTFVVIELKVSRGYDRVIGQLLRYVGWVRVNLAEGQRVRGIIIARQITEDLRLACANIAETKLMEYKLRVQLEAVEF